MFSTIIIEALENKYKEFDGSENLNADAIFWLYSHLNFDGIEEDVTVLKNWLTDHNRCLKCGGELFTTYKKNINTNPPKRELYSFCLNCEG